MGLNNIAGVVQGVSGRAGVKKAAAPAIGAVKNEAGVGTLGGAEKFDHFALEVKVLIEFHLFPVDDATVGAVGVNAPEGDGRIAHGLEEQPLDWRAVGMEHLDLGIGGRTALGGVGFDDPALAGLGLEAEVIGVGR